MAQLIRQAAFTSKPVTLRLTCPLRIVALGRPRCSNLAIPGSWLRCRAAAPNQPAPQGSTDGSAEEFAGIPPEDDVEVPGSYGDALNPQTKLGKAVRAAVEELNHLNAMEMDTLQQCDDLLQKLGIKSSIMKAPAQQQVLLEEEEVVEEQ